jgi:hypothetical protein
MNTTSEKMDEFLLDPCTVLEARAGGAKWLRPEITSKISTKDYSFTRLDPRWYEKGLIASMPKNQYQDQSTTNVQK